MNYLLTIAVACLLPLAAHAQTAIPRALTLADDGTILVATSSPGANGFMRMKITRYNPDGGLRGTLVREVDAATPLLMQMATTEGGRVSITGTGGDAQSPHDIVTFGFDLSQIVSVDEPGAAHAFSLSPAYPNPVSAGRVTVRFETEHALEFRLTLRDIAGREVQEAASGVLPPGRHEQAISTAGLQPGTYFVVFESSRGAMTRKLLVVQ